MPTGVSTKFEFLPQKLKTLGYKTHALGKWHLGFCNKAYTPIERGFESFFGFFTHGEDHYTRAVKDTNGGFQGYDLRHNESVTYEGFGEYSTHLFARKATEVIRKHDNQHPLFLYLAFSSIHKPIQVPEKYGRLYQPYGKLTKVNIRKGMITALDEAVKNVTTELKQKSMLKDTVIIFLSDNGGAQKDSNWPLRGRKNSVWEGGTRTVSFINYRKLVRKLKGSVNTNLFHIVDWFPTILKIAGYNTKSDKTDGFDQWSSLSLGKSGPRRELVYNINTALRFTAAIRVGKWKLIWGYPEGLPSSTSMNKARKQYLQSKKATKDRGFMFLFNLEADPNETVNLADVNKSVLTVLMKRIRKLMNRDDYVKPDTPYLRKRTKLKQWGGIVGPGWCKAK